MALKREAATEKLMLLGVDGLDPRLTRKYVDEGLLPNFKKLIERGAQRHDLVLLGAQPTVTPPQWTTLATGANPYIHGITQFTRCVPGRITQAGYNVDSRLCKAEQVWNCFVEAGKNSLVLHWPGGAWPPTSTREELFVIDGSSPGSVGCATMQQEGETIIGAKEGIAAAKAATLDNKSALDPCRVKEFVEVEMDENKAMPCVIDQLPDDVLAASEKEVSSAAGAAEDTSDYMRLIMTMDEQTLAYLDEAGNDTLYLLMEPTDGYGARAGDISGVLNAAVSPIKPATGWASAPEDAKEFVLLLSKGLVRRVGLILKNENGIYDTVKIYKSKKDTVPMAECPVGKMVYNVADTVIKSDGTSYNVTRHYQLVNIAEDGSELRMYVSAAMDMDSDLVLHPRRLHKEILENVGPFPPQAQLYTHDELLQQVNINVWDYVVDWYVGTIDYMIQTYGIQAIFSHMHSIDFVEHTFIRHLKDIGFNEHDEKVYAQWMVRLYQQCDRYIGKMLHYLDEDWTIIVTSDHAQVAPSHVPVALGDMSGVNIDIMEELGYTVLKRDENGNRLPQIDWAKTTAIQMQGNDIFINLKGRERRGIVDPEDKFELEEKIMTDLYGYKHPDTGKRVVALALRNKDAVLLGYGGPTAGDICIWIAEGYNYDHTDSLSTAYGEGHTSSSPIFIAAGKGLKEGYETNRVIRQVDVAATCCVLGGVRMPRDCEGAPVYQILKEEY